MGLDIDGYGALFQYLIGRLKTELVNELQEKIIQRFNTL